MKSLASALTAGVLAGAAATIAKTKAESIFQPWAEKVWPPAPPDKILPGADPAEHPENMPPAQIVAKVKQTVTGAVPDDDEMMDGAKYVHWAIGLGSAVAYALVARQFPRARWGFGAPAGLALYLATHGASVPAVGLQPPPWRMPAAAVAWEAGSHVVYGVAVDLGLRVIDFAGGV